MIQKSKGQIEDAIAKEATKYYTKTMGAGPRESHTYIVKDLIIVRMKAKLLPIEEKLLEGSRGVELVKDIRKSLHELTVGGMGGLMKSITGHEIISSHSDISTKTGEIIQIYVLDTDFEEEIIASRPVK